MNTFTTKVLNGLGVNNNVSLAQQMKDYAAVGKNLIWQRQMTYVAALSLAGYYYSIKIAILTGCLIAVSEVYDYFVFRDIAAWKSHKLGQFKGLPDQDFCGKYAQCIHHRVLLGINSNSTGPRRTLHVALLLVCGCTLCWDEQPSTASHPNSATNNIWIGVYFHSSLGYYHHRRLH